MTDRTARQPFEVELKLHVPAEVRPLIEAHPALAAASDAPPRRERLITTYFDTPDRRLAEKGFTLRVRRTESGAVQTAKTLGTEPDSSGAASRRGEWEWPVEGDTPDLGLLADTPLHAVLADDTADQLAPVLTTDISRVTRRLRLEDAAVIEAALDDGVLRAGEIEQPIHELELELKEGPVGPLYRLALALQADFPLRIGTESKFAQGDRLLTRRPAVAVKLGDLVLDGRATAGEGLRRMLLAAMGALLGNQAAAAAGDVEGVHQMRIAIRRLRSALVLFAPHLEPSAAGRFNEELRHLGQVLGEKRDWDVFSLQTLPAAFVGSASEHWHGPLLRAAQTERRAAQGRLEEALARPALTGLALALSAWVEDPPHLFGDDRMQARLQAVAPALLDRLGHKVLKRGRHIRRLSGPELHAVRKSLKKLRYGADDMTNLYPQRRVSAYLKHCKRLQKLLGRLNDAAMAATLGKHLGGSGDLGVVPGLSALMHWSEARHAEAIHRLPDAWKAFCQSTPFWG